MLGRTTPRTPRHALFLAAHYIEDWNIDLDATNEELAVKMGALRTRGRASREWAHTFLQLVDWPELPV